MTLSRTRFFFLLGVLCMGQWLYAQQENISDNSPYSRFGLGDLVSQDYASSLGMGGLSATYHDPLHLNSLNPASYAWLRATAYEIGIYSQYSKLESNDQSAEIWKGNLSNIALGFPVRNPINEALDRRTRDFGWGMGFSLTPYSRVAYDVQTSTTLVDSIVGRNVFQGEGGLYRLSWGNGVRYKGFSGGINLNYLFGKMANNRLSFLDNSTSPYFFNEFEDAISVSGVLWSVGFLYEHAFKAPNEDGELERNGKSISFGFYGNSNTKINTNTSNLYRRVYSVALPAAVQSDTISNLSGSKDKATLPLEVSFGVLYEDVNKLRLGFNYSLSQWSSYENPAKSEALSDAFRASVGLEYTPDYLSYNSYLKRVRYRLGAFYENDPRSFDGEQLRKYGLTFGMGMPIILPRQQTSFVNIALEAGQFGIADGLDETYVKLSLGFTLNDNTWFFKRKFN